MEISTAVLRRSKKWLFSCGWQEGRGVFQSGVETLHMALKMTLNNVFPPTLNHTIISWKMKKSWFFECWAYLRLWAYLVPIHSEAQNTYKLCPKFKKSYFFIFQDIIVWFQARYDSMVSSWGHFKRHMKGFIATLQIPSALLSTPWKYPLFLTF